MGSVQFARYASIMHECVNKCAGDNMVSSIVVEHEKLIVLLLCERVRVRLFIYSGGFGS